MTGTQSQRARAHLLAGLCIVLSASCSGGGGIPQVPAPEPVTLAKPPSKQLALLVGINDYKYSEITDLNGAVGDVERMRAVLVGRYGYEPENIRVLTNEQATQRNIVQTFREHLIAQADANTVAVFYYSGHGSRMVDKSGDESDGKDETLVAYDSGRVGNHPNRDVSDDMLNELFSELAEKTEHATAIMDSCHSGGNARGTGFPKSVAEDERDRTEPLPQIRGAQESGSGYDAKTTDYVLISASEAGEYANEFRIDGVVMGALTWALTEALWQAQPDETYRDVMDRVRAKVTARLPQQHPQLEGYRDKLLFGLERRKAEPYVLVTVGEDGPELEMGAAHGLTPGARLDVYPPDTKHFAADKKLGELEVTKVFATRAQARLTKGGPELPTAARAVPIESSYAAQKLRVSFLEPELFATLQAIKARLDEYAHIETTTEESGYDIQLRQDYDNQIITEGASPVPISDPVPIGPDAVERVTQQVLSWAKWYSAERIEAPAHQLDIGLQVEPRKTRDPTRPLPGYFDVRAEAGDLLDIVIDNRTPHELYLNLVVLSSDGSIGVAYPPKGATETIAAGSTWRKPLETCIPRGWDGHVRDTYKLFATRAPADLSLLEQAPLKRGEERKTRSASPHALEDLLAQSALGATRGGRPPGAHIAADAWTTRMRVVEVMPRSEGESTYCD